MSSTGTTTAEALHYNTALSASNAWAVGEDIGATSAVGGSTLIEHWNGTGWSVVPSPTPAGLSAAAAAPGAANEWAAGTLSSKSLILSHG